MDAIHQACGVHEGANDCYICMKNWWPSQAPIFGCEVATFGEQVTTFCFCGTANPKAVADVPVQIVALENQYKLPVSLYQVESGEYVEFCIAHTGKLCEFGVPGFGAPGLALLGAASLATRASHHMRITSADKKLDVGIFSNWTHRVLQAFPLESPTDEVSQCVTWATSASSRIREISDKEPVGKFAVVGGCNSDDCCSAACCASSTDCDTWILSPTNACSIGTADSYKKTIGWRGRSVDEALCSREQHLHYKEHLRPMGMKAHPGCSDADCCQEACCDNKNICNDWGFGTDPTHKTHGCLIGKAKYWTPEYGWVGASGRGLFAASPRLAHTSSQFDGYYKLIVTSSGDVTAESVQPKPFELLA